MSLDNNDILIRTRYALNIKDEQMIDIFALGGMDVTKEEVEKLLIKTKEAYDDEETEENIRCTNAMLESFLNGLITFKRGKQEKKPGQSEKPVRMINSHANVNNVMFKKLKIALALTSDDIIDILASAGVTVSNGELSALLRKEGHKNYKECGDKFARNFLKGLAIRFR